MADVTTLAQLIQAHQAAILDEWLKLQHDAAASRRSPVGDDELRNQSTQFLTLFIAAMASGDSSGQGAAWTPVREFLVELSKGRALQGFTPTDTAMFIFSLKQPLSSLLRRLRPNAQVLADDTWTMTAVLDRLGLLTAESFINAREEVIRRNQQEMLELSTPVVRLWDRILALPLIGTLDSARTQVVMESLLERIVETGSAIAILDITGVPTVDTLVAQHLLKTVAAARLMGADCIISGIRPQIAQTIVHLGVELGSVTTKATLADAFAIALARLRLSVQPIDGTPATAKRD